MFGRNYPSEGYAADGTLCGHCKLVARHDPTLTDLSGNIATAPDPCLGKLPGVSAACCGHGQAAGYVAFDNGVTVYFNDVVVMRTTAPQVPCYGPASEVCR